ncbi:head completion adaptor [Xanthomonas virus PB119]|nr:head completion adaptor [Xanthomonas virus PB119]
MNIEELFEKLSYGPYAALFAGANGTGFIDEKDQPQVLSHANDGLLRLYTKFDLMQKDVLVVMDEVTTNYHLSSRFSPHNTVSNEPRRYILDLPEERFTDDVIRILQVYNSYGYQVPLNDDGNPFSVFTPQGGVLQIPRPLPGQILSVTYQAKHPKLTIDSLDQEVMLPEVLVEGLISYIAYKKYTNMATPESTAKAQEHLAMFNNICEDAIQNDAVSTSSSTTNTRFEKGGFI